MAEKKKLEVSMIGKDPELVALRLLLWREAHDLTQMQMARHLGWKNGAGKISKWETGERFPKVREILEICEIFRGQIYIEWVFEGDAGRMPKRLIELIARGVVKGDPTPFPVRQNLPT